MKDPENFFIAADGIKLCYRGWYRGKPETCIILHGFGEHGGRYEHFVKALEELPFTFFAFDVRGHGRSEGERVYADSIKVYEDDLSSFIDHLSTEERVSCVNLWLFGHSLGGLIATNVVERDSSRFRALILSSPCFQLNGLAWSVFARKGIEQLNRCVPHMVIANLVKSKYLFRDPDLLKSYRNDDMIQHKVTIHLANEIVHACEAVQGRVLEILIPVLILASGDDRIVAVKATESVFRNIKSSEKEIEIYPELYHEIFNEIERQKPISRLKSFIHHQIGRHV